jgi:hypothetical protein
MLGLSGYPLIFRVFSSWWDFTFLDPRIFAFFAFSRFSQFFISATWHPPCINTYLSAENGENEKSARIRTQRSIKGLKIWTQVSTQKQTQTRGLFGKE